MILYADGASGESPSRQLASPFAKRSPYFRRFHESPQVDEHTGGFGS
jgi:hypothetical protein